MLLSSHLGALGHIGNQAGKICHFLIFSLEKDLQFSCSLQITKAQLQRPEFDINDIVCAIGVA